MDRRTVGPGGRVNACWLVLAIISWLVGCIGAQPVGPLPLTELTPTARPGPTLTTVLLPTASDTPAPTLTTTSSPTATVTPTIGPSATATATLTPSPLPPCDCSDNNYDCPAFVSQAAAQTCFDYCFEITGEDRHHLDGDADGRACELLP